MPGQQLLFQLRGDAQAHVDIFTGMVDAAIGRYQFYRKQWVTGAECGYQGSQYMATEGRGRSNAQSALGFTVWGGDGLLGFGKVTFDMADTLVVLVACGCQGHATGCAGKQAHLQVAFQAGEVLADRCRGEAEVTGASGNAAGFDDLDEATDGVEQVHVVALDS